MPIKVDENTYRCSFCEKLFVKGPITETSGLDPMMKAVACEHRHNIIYFPIVKSELNSLLQFIYSKDDRAIPEALYKRLHKYANKRD
jgi:hypothetical protein